MLRYQHEENKLKIPIFAIEGDLFNFCVHSLPVTVCIKHSHKDL